MKKLTLLLTLLFAAGFAFAQGPYRQGMGAGQNWQTKPVTEQMQKMQGLMHYGTVESKKLDQGIQFEVTSADEEVIQTIKTELLEKQKEVKEFFKGAEVSAKDLENGVQLSLSTDDKELVKELQFYGNTLIYRYFREQVRNTALKDGRFKNWGPGFRHGIGYGPRCNLDRGYRHWGR